MASDPGGILQLILFTTDIQQARTAAEAGVDKVMVDWERFGKQARQRDYPTEICADTAEDLSRLSSQVAIPIVVRLNRFSAAVKDEIELALDNGAASLLLPMAGDPQEVESFVRMVNGRAETGIMIETDELAKQCGALTDIDWKFGYIGFNDLMISRKSAWLWEPLLDGTVEHIFNTLPGRTIGFGGITVVGEGSPIRFSSLFREMSRLGCGLGFLRRSFKRDIIGRNMSAEIAAIRALWAAVEARSYEAVRSDHLAFRNELVAAKPARG